MVKYRRFRAFGLVNNEESSFSNTQMAKPNLEKEKTTLNKEKVGSR